MTRLRDVARRLRRSQTEAETRLWAKLRTRQLLGLRFRRQQPVGPFIVDFYCAEARLVIELDGGQHAESRSDAAREAWLRAQGLTILRFWNHEVLANPEGVLTTILTHASPPPHPDPLPRGERGRERRRLRSTGEGGACGAPGPAP